MGIFSQHAPEYWARGLCVIPLIKGSKRPAIFSWSDFSKRPPTEEEKAAWLESYADGNIGLVLGKQSGVVMIDIDTDNPEVMTAILSVLPKGAWYKVGKKGRTLAYRWTEGMDTFRIKDHSGAMIVECLSNKTQTVLPPSIHPDTGKPYVAFDGNLYDHQLLPLPQGIEGILREAIKATGTKLSLSGHSKVVEWQAAGARDNKMIQIAGMYASSILKGEVSFLRAVENLAGWGESQVEKVPGDPLDIKKGVQRIADFLRRDVSGPTRRPLPVGWDEGLDAEAKKNWGLEFDRDMEVWTYDQVQKHFSAFITTPPGSTNEDLRVQEVNRMVEKVAQWGPDMKLMADSIVSWLARNSRTSLSIPALKSRLAVLRKVGIDGENHTEIATEALKVIAGESEMAYHNSQFYRWGGSHWEPKSEASILKVIAEEFGSLPAARRASDHIGIIRVMAAMVQQGLGSAGYGINFANGFLDERGKLFPHDPAYGQIYTLPFQYLPEKANDCIRWREFLHSVWGHNEDYEDKVRCLQEAMCITLMGLGTAYQMCFLLFGVGKSGKSQMLSVLRELLPAHVQSSTPPNNWKDKFLITQLADKLLNAAGELPANRYIADDVFKEVIAGEQMDGQFKGKQVFQFRPRAAHWFASNHLPRSKDTSEGFKRRWMILTFDKPVDDTRRELNIGEAIALREREEIVAWVLEALPRVKEDGFRITTPKSHTETVARMMEEISNVDFFINHHTRQDLDGVQTSMAQFYNDYRYICGVVAHVPPVSLQTFRNRIHELARECNMTVGATSVAGRIFVRPEAGKL